MSPAGRFIGSHLGSSTTSTFGRLVKSLEDAIGFSNFGSHLDPVATSMVSGIAKTMSLGFVGIFISMIIVGIVIAIGIGI